MFGMILLAILAAFGLSVLVAGVKIIGQAEVIVIERLGRFHRVGRSGLNLLIPFIERPRPIDVRYFEADVSGMKRITAGTTSRIDLREQVLNFPSQPVITKDNVTIDIDAVLYYRIADPQKATYAVQNLPYALETLTRTTLRNIVGEMELDQTLASRDQINKRMREVIEEASIGWGVDVTRVELQAIEPPRDIQQSMELQMRAERERRAAVTNAEAGKRAAILEAEGLARVAGAEGRGREGSGDPARRGSRDRATGNGAGRGRGDPAHHRIAARRAGRDVPARPQVPRGAASRHAGQGNDDLPSRRSVRRHGRARRDARAAQGHGGPRRRGRRPKPGSVHSTRRLRPAFKSLADGYIRVEYRRFESRPGRPTTA